MERPRTQSNASHRPAPPPPPQPAPTTVPLPAPTPTGSVASKSRSTPSRSRTCRTCGQHHSHHEPHLYNYNEEVDEDLMCQICLQPFVQPVDTPCCHTFCHACMNSYLKVNQMCPLDRKPVNEMSISPSNLVLKRLLDKQTVTCPHSDSCSEVLQRGNLDDHLRYHCSGTLVACQFAGAGCEYRGPSKSMNKHQNECKFRKEGITRLPVLEGEVSHVEIPRTSQSLGVTIVGGADTPLRCVVVQEVYPDGLIAQDGRLQPGDQIIEINGVDMTCSTHGQVCAALRKMSSVLRLGVYRERIEKYGGGAAKNNNSNGHAANGSNGVKCEELLTVTVERQASKQLGIRLSGNCSEPGLYIVDIQDNSAIAADGRLQKFDRLLFINGQDVRHCRINQASSLIQKNDKVSLVVARKTGEGPSIRNLDEIDCSSESSTPASSATPPEVTNGQNGQTNGQRKGGGGSHGSHSSSLTISHTRSRSEPAINQKNKRRGGGGGRGAAGRGGAGGDEYDEDEDEYSESDDDSDDDAERVNTREEEVPELRPRNGSCGVAAKRKVSAVKMKDSTRQRRATSDDTLTMVDENVYDLPAGEDYLAIYETLDRVKKKADYYGGGMGSGLASCKSDLKSKSHSMEALETPTPSLKSFEFPDNPDHLSQQQKAEPQQPSQGSWKDGKKKGKSKADGAPVSNGHGHRKHSKQPIPPPPAIPPPPLPVPPPPPQQQQRADEADGFISLPAAGSMAAFLKRALRMEGPQLQQRLITIKKNARESLGMRIGGGIGSNEGDTPIYIANIHPHGCIGKSKQMKKGDLLLSVDEVGLCGLTHTQAVATLKATIARSVVTLGIMDGPETSYGASNFIPSWMFWQKLPRSLQYPKTVILHRRELASWGFSIVGGADVGGGVGGGVGNGVNGGGGGSSAVASGTGRPTEPIHVLFVVPESPAAKDAKLRCGDRLLAVDGHTLENIPHALAVSMLKQTSTRVVLEVVSWMGTEL